MKKLVKPVMLVSISMLLASMVSSVMALDFSRLKTPQGTSAVILPVAEQKKAQYGPFTFVYPTTDVVGLEASILANALTAEEFYFNKDDLLGVMNTFQHNPLPAGTFFPAFTVTGGGTMVIVPGEAFGAGNGNILVTAEEARKFSQIPEVQRAFRLADVHGNKVKWDRVDDAFLNGAAYAYFVQVGRPFPKLVERDDARVQQYAGWKITHEGRRYYPVSLGDGQKLFGFFKMLTGHTPKMYQHTNRQGVPDGYLIGEVLDAPVEVSSFEFAQARAISGYPTTFNSNTLRFFDSLSGLEIADELALAKILKDPHAKIKIVAAESSNTANPNK